MQRFSRNTRRDRRGRANGNAWWGLLLLAGCIGISGGVGARVLTDGQDGETGVPLMALDVASDRPAEPRVHQIVDAPAPQRAADHPEPTPARAETQVSSATPVRVVVDDTRPTFDGRKLVAKRTVRMLVTAYSPDERSCGIFADGKTASGKSVWTNGLKLVAADTRLLPFGTVISVPGYNDGRPVQVLDRGGKIKGHRLDVLYPTHEIARGWGKQYLDVTVYEYASE